MASHVGVSEIDAEAISNLQHILNQRYESSLYSFQDCAILSIINEI